MRRDKSRPIFPTCSSLYLSLFSLQLPQTLPFSLFVSPSGIKGGGRRGRWQISAVRPACPSVCCQKIEFICAIQMLMLSFVCVRVVAQSEERIGHWTGEGRRWVCLMVEGGGAGKLTSAMQLLYSHQRKQPWPDDSVHCLTTMTRYSINTNGSWHMYRAHRSCAHHIWSQETIM